MHTEDKKRMAHLSVTADPSQPFSQEESGKNPGTIPPHQVMQRELTETRTDQAIRDSEVSYRRLFEAARDGILILDMHTGCITDVNPFLFKLLGFSRKEMIGKTVGELSPFKDIEANRVMLERLQEHGYVRYEDLRWKRAAA
jgi:PAS domain-containing protein